MWYYRSSTILLLYSTQEVTRVLMGRLSSSRTKLCCMGSSSIIMENHNAPVDAQHSQYTTASSSSRFEKPIPLLSPPGGRPPVSAMAVLAGTALPLFVVAGADFGLRTSGLRTDSLPGDPWNKYYPPCSSIHGGICNGYLLSRCTNNSDGNFANKKANASTAECVGGGLKQ